MTRTQTADQGQVAVTLPQAAEGRITDVPDPEDLDHTAYTWPRMFVYNATESWEAFKFQFERTATRRRWKPQRKAEQLLDCLGDVVLEYARIYLEFRTMTS